MAKLVLKAAYVSINGVDLSSYASKSELSIEVEDQDATTYTSEGWKEVLGGLKSGSLSCTFKQDPAAGAIDDQMWALLGEIATFEVRLKQDPVGASNPAYTGNLLVKWSPIAGEVGAIAQVETEMPTTGRVNRATA